MIYDYYKEANKKKNKFAITLGILVLALIFLLRTAFNIYLDLIQLNEIGNFTSIYITNLTYKFLFGVISFIVIFATFYITNIFIKKNIKNYVELNNREPIKVSTFKIPFLLGVIGAFLTKDFFYERALSFINSVSFDRVAPIFEKDISYFIFERPFLMSVYSFFETLSFLVILYTAIHYVIFLIKTFNITLEVAFSEIKLKSFNLKTIISHNLFNVAVFFIVKSFSYTFQKEEIVYNTFLNLTGANYVDANIWLRYFNIAPFLLIIITILTLYFVRKIQFKKAILTIAVFPAAWVITAVIAMGFQFLVVAPNEVEYERKYLQYHIHQTQQAYGFDKIQSIAFPEIETPTLDTIRRNPEIKDNIRVIDYESTLLSNIELQRNTNFYTFAEGDIINFEVNGRETPVFITAREINTSRLPDSSYINTTYKYTHGYGVVINPINRLTSRGQVDFILSGLRLNSIDENIKIDEPRIYYGELKHNHVIVNAANNLNEIDYDGHSETRYSGKGGIRLGFLNRAIFALKYSDLKMITSNYIQPESRILLNRQVVERAQKALPFLIIDNDPYIMISEDGRLKWILDGYTVTDKYPYAQRYGNINYIRNSVKVTIDAYDGTTEAYIIDQEDPVIQVYKNMYPDIFIEGDLPQYLRNHMRYPEKLFKIQTQMLTRYHIDSENISTFYSNQNLWDIARYPTDRDSLRLNPIEPYYNMIKLPGGLSEREELVLMRPFTPGGEEPRHNLVAWLAVRNSYDNYGEMVLYRFPKNTNILGPNQIAIKINQDDKISQDMTLWGQSGSSVYKGELLIIPIENSILYVEPILIKASGDSSIPEVRRIIVGYQQGDEFEYGIGNDLDSALDDLFGIEIIGTDREDESIESTDEIESEVVDQKIIEEIISKYNLIKSQLEELGYLINSLE